jgi:hypothetical protein
MDTSLDKSLYLSILQLGNIAEDWDAFKCGDDLGVGEIRKK